MKLNVTVAVSVVQSAFQIFTTEKLTFTWIYLANAFIHGNLDKMLIALLFLSVVHKAMRCIDDM